MIALWMGSCVPMHCAAEPIVWFSTVKPPGIFAEGPEQGHGYLDQLISYVLHTLPQYQVTVSQVPLTRELQVMKKGGAYCSLDPLKTPERETFLRFTAPYGYILPPVLVVRAEDKNHFDRYVDANRMLSLERLMQVDPGMFGVAARRTFGKIPDSIVAQALVRNPARITQVYEENGTETLFKMLTAHHIDAMMAYPVEQVYRSVQVDHADHYYAYPLVESQKLVTMRFDCTLQAQTDGIFTALDEQAKSPPLQHAFQSAYERWLPSYLLPLYRARLKDSTQAASF